MLEVNKIILDMISQNKSMKEISRFLNISEKQLYIKLKQLINKGFILTPSYSYNSDIYYKLENNLISKQENEITLTMPKKQKEFRCLVISDLHIGHIGGDLNLAYILYDYATKNNINIILFCGDMIEGDYTTDRKSIKELYKQIETFIKKFPYDKNIIMIGILGNHEYHYITRGLDIVKWISQARYDIVPIGYGQGKVAIKNDFVYLKHRLSKDEGNIEQKDAKVEIRGHGHMMRTKLIDKFCLCAPTLSYKSPDATKELKPGFIDLVLSFDENKFEYVEAHHMVILPEIIELDNTKCKIKTLFNNDSKKK